MENSRIEVADPVTVDMEEIIKFALGKAGAKEVSAIETKASHLKKNFKFSPANANNDEATLEITEEDYEAFFYQNSYSTDLTAEWENRVHVDFFFMNNNELYRICVHHPAGKPYYPNPTELKKYDPARWREAIMFAANEWWKDG